MSAPAIDRAAVLKAVDDEPELPGEIPPDMWHALQGAALIGDQAFISEALRIAVRQTKQGIRERLEAIWHQPCERDEEIKKLRSGYSDGRVSTSGSVRPALDRDQTDCIIARLKCCGGIVFVVVNDTHVTKKDREEIGALAASGLAIEHLTVAEVRKKKWGCKCTHSEGK